MEFFCKPGTELEWFKFYKEKCVNFLKEIGSIKSENIRLRDHAKEELCFYSNATTDIEYNFPFGFGELLKLPQGSTGFKISEKSSVKI